MTVKKDEKFSPEMVSNSFLGIRSMGLFAPLSYWRSEEDPGIGDIDTLYKVIDFARLTDQGIIQMLPLNLPSADNCPYAIASNYILDPVYIGIRTMFEFLGNDVIYSRAKDLYEAKAEIFSGLRKNPKSTNDLTRSHKYDIFKQVFDAFQKFELKEKPLVMDIAAVSKDKKSGSLKSGFLEYCGRNGSRLFDHVLFFILAKEFGNDDFRKWDETVARRDPDKIKDLKARHNDGILFESFLQWILHEQLTGVLRYAKNGEKPVDIMLDQPFAFGNADVWININAFHINPKTMKKDYTQGVPPHRLDIPQHWQFTLLNFRRPFAKKLLLDRIGYLLEYCTLLRIDHLPGYYQMYYLSEDISWKMTLGKMKIWAGIDAIKKSGAGTKEKRDCIYRLILEALKNNLPEDVVSKVFDTGGNLRYGSVVLACRKEFTEGHYDKNECGWYEVNSTEHSRKLLYALLSPNNFGEDYLEKIIQYDADFLKPDDSIRVGFFNPGLGEELVSDFIRLAHLQGKELIFENLGLVPGKAAQSMRELGTCEFKPLYFGYQFFKGDHNAYWFDNINDCDYCSFSIHDTVTIEGWWTGLGEWAEKKYYFSDVQQKIAVFNWLIYNNYLGYDEKRSTETLTEGTHRAVLSSVSDANANMAVFMMPDIFKSGEEGIINIPGYGGFWTARSPVTIERLLDESSGNSPEGSSVKLIRHLSCYKNRNSAVKQFESFGDLPRVIKTYPVCGHGYKQIGFLNGKFMVDAVVLGKADSVKLMLNDTDFAGMKRIVTADKIPAGLSVYRVFIQITENHIKTNTFRIFIDDKPGTDRGYLVGLPLKTDTNPLSDNYGKITD